MKLEPNWAVVDDGGDIIELFRNKNSATDFITKQTIMGNKFKLINIDYEKRNIYKPVKRGITK